MSALNLFIDCINNDTASYQDQEILEFFNIKSSKDLPQKCQAYLDKYYTKVLLRDYHTAITRPCYVSNNKMPMVKLIDQDMYVQDNYNTIDLDDTDDFIFDEPTGFHRGQIYDGYYSF